MLGTYGMMKMDAGKTDSSFSTPYQLNETGDLNADPNTPNGTHLHNFCDGNNLSTHITKPTRITEHTATILDQFLTNIPDQVIETQILSPISTCDHCPITITLNFQTVKPKSFTRLTWNYNDAD